MVQTILSRLSILRHTQLVFNPSLLSSPNIRCNPSSRLSILINNKRNRRRCRYTLLHVDCMDLCADSTTGRVFEAAARVVAPATGATGSATGSGSSSGSGSGSGITAATARRMVPSTAGSASTAAGAATVCSAYWIRVRSILSSPFQSPLMMLSAVPTIRLHLDFRRRLCRTLRLPRSTELARLHHSTSKEPMQIRRRHHMALRLHLRRLLQALNRNLTVHHFPAAQEEGRRVQTMNMPTLLTCWRTATMARIPMETLVLCGTAKHRLVELLRRRRGSARTIHLLSSSSSNTRKIQSNPSFLSSMDVWI